MWNQSGGLFEVNNSYYVVGADFHNGFLIILTDFYYY